MQPDRWGRVKEIFAAALERAPAQRALYVEEACSSDADLFAEVSSLLEAHDTAGDFIEEPAAQRAGLVNERPARQWVGHRLGPYRIVAEAGRGGMSQVFKAVRDDQQYEKQVAIKLLKPGLDTESLLRRFKAERQMLAQLSHPNIAHLLDGGATEDGAPYLVMEYIEGKPIDVYCDDRKLDVDQRLDLFRTLCSAVHYVHQHLMVHGDLKGGNVLVTEQGTVKLLDFGIAKLLNPTPVIAPEQARATTFLALTPEYASPEQVRGESITTASDVYSLGVLLYKLLAGELPYKSTGASTWALATEICESDPAPPSVTAEKAGGAHARFAKILKGDLDNVALKALKKVPEERYASAEQLAEDLRRYLRGFPVAARADTTGYRVRKFAQRHRSAAIAAGLFIIALTTGIITTTWQAQVARQERARAERHFNDVRELTAVYLADVYDAVSKLPGGTAARKLLVENSIKYLTALEQEAQDSPELQHDLAIAYERLGDVQGDYIGANLGDVRGAVDSYRRSLNIRRSLAERDPSLQARRELLRISVVLSELVGGLSETQEALTLAKEAAQLADGMLEDPEATVVDRRYAAAAHMTFGWEQGLLGELDAGMKSLLKARGLYQQIAAENPEDLKSQRDLMVIAGRIGNVYLDKAPPEPDKALPFYEESLRLVEPLIAKTPDDVELQRSRAFILTTIGETQNDLGRPQEALENHSDALEVLERLWAADDADRMAPITVAFALNGRGKSHLLLDHHEDALVDFNRAETILRTASPAQLTDLAAVRLLPGLIYTNLARTEAELARRDSTRGHLRSDHARKAHEWSELARETVQPMMADPVEGERAKRTLEEIDLVMKSLPRSDP